MSLVGQKDQKMLLRAPRRRGDERVEREGFKAGILKKGRMWERCGKGLVELKVKAMRDWKLVMSLFTPLFYPFYSREVQSVGHVR